MRLTGWPQRVTVKLYQCDQSNNKICQKKVTKSIVTKVASKWNRLSTLKTEFTLSSGQMGFDAWPYREDLQLNCTQNFTNKSPMQSTSSIWAPKITTATSPMITMPDDKWPSISHHQRDRFLMTNQGTLKWRRTTVHIMNLPEGLKPQNGEQWKRLEKSVCLTLSLSLSPWTHNANKNSKNSIPTTGTTKSVWNPLKKPQMKMMYCNTTTTTTSFLKDWNDRNELKYSSQ